MLTKCKEIGFCRYKLRNGSPVGVDVVVDLLSPGLIGRRRDGDALACGQSSTGELVNLEYEQNGNEPLSVWNNMLVAKIIVRCPQTRCNFHSQHQG